MSVKVSRIVTALVLLAAATALAQDKAITQARERCATRVSIAFTGKSPNAAMMSSEDPLSSVPTLVNDPAFIERFSRFINASFNRDLGASAAEDAAYYLTKEVLSTGRPWRDLFVGPYRVDKDPSTGSVKVFSDPNGLGYFRSLPWLKRYAGNEPQGYKLSTAYRIMNNTIGLQLVASTNAPDADVSTGTRSTNSQCRVCHFDSFFALDKVARVLTKRVGTGDTMTFSPPDEGPQPLFGTQIKDDKELVEALVNSTDFQFRACRLAFNFLYGRDENTCEGPIFDRCMDAFALDGKIQSAITSVATDASFCQ
ncbi:MAG: hypothetical protein ACJ790_02505 [Myxococcaceae bacterium]